MQWDDAYHKLTQFAASNTCTPLSPPRPLILSGWAYSNDVEKMRRWEETVAWANRNGCPEIVKSIGDDGFYFVSVPTTYAVSPTYGPMYRQWDFEKKPRPSFEQLAKHFNTLESNWAEIIGSELGSVTRPIAFTGEKSRRLLVLADDSHRPPWGDWDCLSPDDALRRTFTRFREAINRAIAPHEVDHIDFRPDA